MLDQVIVSPPYPFITCKHLNIFAEKLKNGLDIRITELTVFYNQS
jgi:hypothetical protein